MEFDNEKNKPEFFSYKKVLLFGAESTGKSSFANRLKTGLFKDDIKHTEEGNKYIYINIIQLYQLKLVN